MKTQILIPLFASCLIFLSGCVAPQQQQQIVPAVAYISKDVPLNKIIGAIIDSYVGDGWKLERESDHLITFSIENTNFKAQLLYSSRYESRVFNRVSVTLSESTDGTTVRANQEIVTNYGSSFEKAEPIAGNGKDADRLAAVKRWLQKTTP